MSTDGRLNWELRTLSGSRQRQRHPANSEDWQSCPEKYPWARGYKLAARGQLLQPCRAWTITVDGDDVGSGQQGRAAI
ncbi:hypothetical protein NDU88_004709 [Pleurodeles waltl]|uniref:Uncharacterized protein n=1 Tax=Pleurodeles waltl TaxID=8319 RepID=A0AAV7SJK0_PLEWA|nr:hypothetical protein NDU88_004709 [Pleurodeles waltl]